MRERPGFRCRLTDTQTLGTLRDALAIIALADREERESVMTFLSLYHGERVTDFERGQLAGSFLTLAVEISRCCASASGIPTDKILGSVAASLQSAR